MFAAIFSKALRSNDSRPNCSAEAERIAQAISVKVSLFLSKIFSLFTINHQITLYSDFLIVSIFYGPVNKMAIIHLY